jgi:hypothetical protein
VRSRQGGIERSLWKKKSGHDPPTLHPPRGDVWLGIFWAEMSEAVLYGTLEDVLAGAEAEDNSLGAFGLRARVIIHNKSTRTLQYKTCGTESSYFYTASRRGFNSNFEIESGKAGGFLQYRSFSGLSIIANERCKGYLSLTVPCDGKDYVAVLAWCRFQIGRNKAGIQIRSETGLQMPQEILLVTELIRLEL